jgi:hypothetical protein
VQNVGIRGRKEWPCGGDSIDKGRGLDSGDGYGERWLPFAEMETKIDVFST